MNGPLLQDYKDWYTMYPKTFIYTCRVGKWRTNGGQDPFHYNKIIMRPLTNQLNNALHVLYLCVTTECQRETVGNAMAANKLPNSWIYSVIFSSFPQRFTPGFSL